MLRKIACNATNSGAIDQSGNVYVWGAGKYGLLGNPKQKNPISKPIRIHQLDTGSAALDQDSEQAFVATNISFGQYHAAVVVNDINTNSIFNQLLYAQHILEEMKQYLLNHWDEVVKKQKEYENQSFAAEEYQIENALRFCFYKQERNFPYITLDSLKDFMVYEAKLPFKDTVSYNRLFQDLADSGDEDKINLKELRDQLIGRRCGNGIVFTWGIINDGRLGIEIPPDIRQNLLDNRDELIPWKPTNIKFTESIIITKVSCGNSYTLALSSDGLVYSWGLGNSGGLGLGEANLCYTPQMIKQQKNGHEFKNIKDIVCGSNHSIALDQQHRVFSWGNGQGGRLGHGDQTGENSPKEIISLRDIKVIIIEAGEANSACISFKNELYLWGTGLNGRLGNGQTSNVLNPTQVEDLKDQKVEDITLGTSHTLCLLRNGKGMCWGASKDGKLGLETAMDRNFMQPKELVTLEKEKIFQYAAGPFHSLVLTENGEIFSFGNAKGGKLGFDENNSCVYIPKKIFTDIIFTRKLGISDRGKRFPLFAQYDEHMQFRSEYNMTVACEIIQVASGFNNTVFLINDGQLYACGSNKYGQLGISKKNQKASAKEDDDMKDDGETAGGGEGGFANENVNLNDVSADDLLPPQLRKKLQELEQQQDVQTPQPVRVMHDAQTMRIKHIAVGYFHVLAVTYEGLTFGWGRNDYGQLGNGRKESCLSKPTRIKSLLDKKIVMTAAGENHSLFLNDTGEVLCAGFNEFGELGIGLQGIAAEKKEDEQYDENAEQLQIDSKIELTPKMIKGLESIGYISCGKNHSVAIRSIKMKEKELRMYTWGCGWNGQIGHGNWQNVYEPKIVKVPVVKDTKFIMAACGAKHTIVLDENGQIWFFGNKNSVGIEDLQEEKQFTPQKLELPSKIKESFKYITSNEEHNLAVTASGIVYGFGKNTHSKINSSKKEFIYFENVDSDEKARLTSCGANHSVLIDLKGVPYSWGNTLNGRCGLKLESEDMKQQRETISNPTVIYSMKVMFNAELQRIKENIGDQRQQQQDDQKDMEIRFPIQKILKEHQQSLNEEIFVNQDRFLVLNFNKMVEEFHTLIKTKNESFLNSFYNAQNAVISRIYTFPSRIDILTDIKAELPKALIRNKQIYEAIFSFLQIHPCYLINWITKTTVNRQPKEVIDILKKVFGEKEMRNDPRILHILMMIAKRIFQFEMGTHELEEILLGRNESTFIYLFNLVFQNQDENIDYINQLISSIVQKLQKFFNKLHLRQFQVNGGNPQSKSKAYIKSQFDYESVIQENDKADSRISYLIDFMEICFKKIIKTLDPQFKTGKSGATLSNEVFSLIYAIKEEINLKKSANITQEDIDSYILNLVFENLCKKLQDLNFEKIKDFYWKNSKETPDADIFFTEKRNLLSVLAAHIEKYLKKDKIHYTNQPVNVLKQFISNNKVNYRKKISELLDQKAMNFDYLLMKDLFINSMELKNATLNISVKDIIEIYNSLVEKGEIIFIHNHDEDPILLLLNELGKKPIEIKQNERQLISEDVLEYKINLEIKSRLLIEHSQITKCVDCNAPIYEDLVPIKRFREAINDKQWQCQNKECKGSNEANIMMCMRCGRIRDPITFPKDQVFLKYKQVVSDPIVNIFQMILLYMPIVNIHENLDKIIDQELNTEEKKKGADYNKLQVIEQFKKFKTNYLFQNKKKTFNIDDANGEKAAEKEVETELLWNLEQRIKESYESKKSHEQRLQEYNKFLQEIRDKISNYIQKNQQIGEEFKLIIENAYTGLGSEFLRNEKQDIRSGRLHLKGGKIAMKQAVKGRQQLKSNQQLEHFFKELDKTNANPNQILYQNQQEIIQNKEIFKSNFGFFGRYPLYQLRQRKVLHNIEIHGKKLQTIMKKCCYVFYDNGDNGYKVELIYEESDRKCLVFGQTSNEAILESFIIHKDVVAEMRRTFATKATIQFGNSEFNVFELVFLLNEIKSKTYSYGVKAAEGQGQAPAVGPAMHQQVPQDKSAKKDGKKDKKQQEEVKADNKI